MLSVSQARERVAVIVPVHFDPAVPIEVIAPILEGVFRDSELFCRPDRLLAVVDGGTKVDTLLSNPPSGSSFSGVPLHRLDRNRAKAGAVSDGLRLLLQNSDAEYFVTRDCDGDHVLEDIPRMVSLAEDVQEQTGQDLVTVMGARPSLEKPMGWLRQEWELFTNKILVDIASFAVARLDRVIDCRFWNGFSPDIQSGYRVYSRAAAEVTMQCLSSLPEKREILMLACESVPFTELLIDGGVFAQVQRLTLVEQPVSSYSQVNFGENYGHLISFLGEKYGIPKDILLRIIDNAMVSRSMYFTDFRDQLLLFRSLIAPGANAPELPGFV